MTRSKSNRFIAMLLAVIVVFSAMPMTALTANAATVSSNTTEFAGSGMVDDPYLVSTKEHSVTTEGALTSTIQADYERLCFHIEQNGTIDSDGYKYVSSDYTSSSGVKCNLFLIYRGVDIKIRLDTNSSSYFITSEAVIDQASAQIVVQNQTKIYVSQSYTDKIDNTLPITRALHSFDSQYTVENGGTYFGIETVSQLFSLNLQLLCLQTDEYLYNNLNFGLNGLGFENYYYGGKICDEHKYDAWHKYNGTHSRTCSVCHMTDCGMHIWESTTLEYSAEVCNICGAIRTATGHVYDNACDSTCNECSATRTVPGHVYTHACDTTCNECGYIRNVQHTFVSGACNVCSLKQVPVAIRVTATSVTLAPYTGYEYSKDGTTWQTSNVFTGLNANTAYKFYQRTADTDASAPSAACNVTTSAKSACSVTPAAPIVAETTTNKVVLVAREGYEYSKNGTTWQTSNTFSGLSSNTSYTFYQRIAETGSELASSKSTGVTVKTFTSSSGTTAATNYDRLRSYISSYGTTGSNGNKSIVRSSTTSGGLTIYYSLENTSSGIEFALLTSQNTSTKLVGQTEFVLTRSSTNISVYSSMLYYYSGSLADSASGTKSLNRSTYSASTTYSFYQSGSIITGSDFSENFNTTMELLCTYWDSYIYSNLGFGLKGLGFKSFSGKGSTVCDPLASYHTGSTVTRNAHNATCTTDGYTGDTYCANCGEKKSSGSVIACSGHHTYSNSCDKTCNTCGEERVIEHQYSNICDTTCNVCNATRAEIEHTFDNACDETCNGCSETRKAPHVYDDNKDLICNGCGHERPPYAPGDVTGDDKINSLDGLMLLRYLNGWIINITTPEAMDVNGDGKVNSLDGLILMRYLNGWNVTLG